MRSLSRVASARPSPRAVLHRAPVRSFAHAAHPAPFSWSDPLNLQSLLTEDEKLIQVRIL